MLNYSIAIVFALILFGVLVWIAWKDIKETKEERLSQKKLLVYLGVFAFSLVLLVGLRVFAAESLTRLYYLFGGAPIY